MNYQEAITFLFDRLPMFSRIGAKAVKHGLKNIQDLCAVLDHPENSFKSIHVAGTNGKGSTSHMIAATLQEAGYTVGLYTSPHLVDVRERFRINGACVPEAWVADFITQYEQDIIEIAPSYFELNVAMAFAFFRQAKVDFAVIETGLGGRMDSTNVVTPILSVITQIALDHTDILGDTLVQIAGEKAGIIKPTVPVVIGKTQVETEPVFVQKALLCQAPIYFADTLFSLVKKSEDLQYTHYKGVRLFDTSMVDIHTDMQGAFQMDNIITAWAAIYVLTLKGVQVTETHFLNALQQVKQLTGLRGRWDHVGANIFLDVGHNPDGITQIVKHIKALEGNTHVVYGSVKDKDVRASVALLPKDVKYYITQANVPRAMPIETLSEIFTAATLDYEQYSTVALAVAAAMSQRKAEDNIVIIGSFFVVGEAYAYLENIKF